METDVSRGVTVHTVPAAIMSQAAVNVSQAGEDPGVTNVSVCKTVVLKTALCQGSPI